MKDKIISELLIKTEESETPAPYKKFYRYRRKHLALGRFLFYYLLIRKPFFYKFIHLTFLNVILLL